uniref:RRM domain-containing protein n=1 Tax=Malurus cyaneus samueli TaxID=2593467 RepID=A0A8C5TAG3_9PASS
TTVSQGYVLPEGKIMPNTVFVGGIDIKMNEAEIRSVFEQYGTVKEVKVITDRTGVSKGYGFVSFLENVDVQKIVESQINFHGKKLKLGPAIRKQQNLNSCVHPRRLVVGPPAPQFQSVWSNQTMEIQPYVQPPPVMNPVTPYVQVRLCKHIQLLEYVLRFQSDLTYLFSYYFPSKEAPQPQTTSKECQYPLRMRSVGSGGEIELF